MPDNTLEILIRTKAELTGARQAAEAMEQQIGALKAQGKATDELKQQLDRAKQAIRDYTDQFPETQSEVEKLAEAHHALHLIGRQIGVEDLPQLVQAMMSLREGPLGVLEAVASVLELVSQDFEKLREQTLELENRQFDAQAKAAQDMAIAMQQFADDLQRAGQLADPLKTRLEDQLAIIHELAEAHKTVLDQMEKEDLAAAKGDKTLEDQIKNRYDQIRDRNAQATAKTSEETISRDIFERRQRSSTLADAHAGALDKVNALKSDPEIARANQIIADAGKSGRAGLADKIISPEEIAGLQAALPFSENPEGIQMRLGKAEAAQKALDEYDRATETIKQYNLRLAELNDRADKTKKAADENAQAITDETEQLKKQRSAREAGRAGGIIGEAIDITRHGGASNPAERAFIQTAGTLVAGQSESYDQALQMFQAAARSDKVLKDFIDRLFRAFDLMGDHWDAANTRLSQIESRMATLKNSGLGGS